MRWVLEEVRAGMIAVWPEGSREAQLAFESSHRTVTVAPVASVEEDPSGEIVIDAREWIIYGEQAGARTGETTLTGPRLKQGERVTLVPRSLLCAREEPRIVHYRLPNRKTACGLLGAQDSRTNPLSTAVNCVACLQALLPSPWRDEFTAREDIQRPDGVVRDTEQEHEPSQDQSPREGMPDRAAVNAQLEGLVPLKRLKEAQERERVLREALRPFADIRIYRDDGSPINVCVPIANIKAAQKAVRGRADPQA